MKQKIHSVIDIFSYWIFIWFILFYFEIIKYNPFYFLILGLLSNVLQSLLYLYHNNYRKFVYFVIVNTIIKIIPLLLIRKCVKTNQDFLFGIFLSLVYICYIYIKRQMYNQKSKTLYESVLSDAKTKQISTPGMKIVQQIVNVLQ